ncbi:MAG: glutamyl-tRNA amidotransferase [Acidobacteria bacterium RIFCSPLOWO2_02_FULL_59_13]|nr:MAG: glutamyl-tRNA amidotransferase [Acidobacteria bacterium RIFCSPLOWO2_02_FULL_59_13]
MKITEKDVGYVAALANLELEEEEIARLVTDLDSILAYVDKLNELDTAAVLPMAQVLFDGPEGLAFREDRNRAGFAQELALSNAPESGAGQFKVAKVIER